MSEIKGIQIEENPNHGVAGQTKFNLRVDPELLPILVGEDLVPQLVEKHGWVKDEDTEWYVRGYTATDSGYAPADADDKCPG